jgi:MFS family permease
MIINQNKAKEYFNWKVLFIISLSSIAMGVYRDGISALFPFLQNEFSLTRTQVAFYSTSLYIASMTFSIFSGRLVDIKGAKRGMILGILFVGFFLIAHTLAHNFAILLVFAACAGIGMSINPSAANKGITEWFPQRWRNSATGIWSTSFPIGGALAASFLPILGILIGWRKALFIPGFFILFCGLLIFLIYHDNERVKNNLKKYSTKAVPFWEDFSKLSKNSDLIAISVFGFFLGATEGAILTHFTLFLYLDYGLNESIAGLGFAFVQFGSISGRLIWSVVCDKFLNADRRKAFVILASIFLLTTLVFSLFLKNIHPSVTVLFFLAFLAGFSGRGWDGLFFPSVTEIVKTEQVGVAIGLSVLFIRAGILLAPPIFGYIADLRGAYDMSWLLLGLIMFSTSIAQYLVFIRKIKRLD